MQQLIPFCTEDSNTYLMIRMHSISWVSWNYSRVQFNDLWYDKYNGPSDGDMDSLPCRLL